MVASTPGSLHIQAERGLVDYAMPIAHYWPEFGAAYFGRIIGSHALSFARTMRRRRAPERHDGHWGLAAGARAGDPFSWIYKKEILDKDPRWYEKNILGSGPFNQPLTP